MQILNRKNLTQVQTGLLIKLRTTLLRRVEIVQALNRNQSKMLVDVLGELDYRQANPSFIYNRG
jgi:hypothetical protein